MCLGPGETQGMCVYVCVCVCICLNNYPARPSNTHTHTQELLAWSSSTHSTTAEQVADYMPTLADAARRMYVCARVCVCVCIYIQP